MSWWNKRENVAKVLMPKPTLGDNTRIGISATGNL